MIFYKKFKSFIKPQSMQTGVNIFREISFTF